MIPTIQQIAHKHGVPYARAIAHRRRLRRRRRAALLIADLTIAYARLQAEVGPIVASRVADQVWGRLLA
jgi:hypothetical protein